MGGSPALVPYIKLIMIMSKNPEARKAAKNNGVTLKALLSQAKSVRNPKNKLDEEGLQTQLQSLSNLIMTVSENREAVIDNGVTLKALLSQAKLIQNKESKLD